MAIYLSCLGLKAETEIINHEISKECQNKSIIIIIKILIWTFNRLKSKNEIMKTTFNSNNIKI